jgi:hypothetical protein
MAAISVAEKFGEQIRRIRPPPWMKCENAMGASATKPLEKNPAARS